MHSQKTMRSGAASNRLIEELETKIRLLERKRLEDRDLRQNLDHAEQEREQYKSIIEKLQNKYRPQQQEVAELKKQLGEWEKKGVDLENLQAEHDSQLEMITLDREMAEEMAQACKAELEALRAHCEEADLELEILREENSELGKEMTPEERESAGYAQLQHSNERLRDALLALRDRSVDEKEELNGKIEALEEQLCDFDQLKARHEENREKLFRSEADTEDLRQQLEVALQAEEMIEGLTERNGKLESTVDNLKAAIEDLENLRELNDELEVNHVKAEKQMQEEIDFKESLLYDRDKTLNVLQEMLDDQDHTITQFRALVNQLQADMADAKASQQLSVTEAKDLEGKSRAMLDLNLKLQNSAAKTQVKTIDLELRKLDAQEASEHLSIVQLFLPESFRAERDSVLAMLRFKRIGFKVALIHGFVKDRLASFDATAREDDIFATCEVLYRLTWISSMAQRFIRSIYSCSSHDFAQYEGALYELEPVERAVNGYIDGLRRDELKEATMAQELQRSTAVMAHLGSLHLKDDLASHADDLLMRTECLQSQLESATAALQIARTMIARNSPQSESDDEDEGSVSDTSIILTRLDSLANSARSAKVTAQKSHRVLLEDLHTRSLTLDGSCTKALQDSETIAKDVVEYTTRAGHELQMLFGDEGRSGMVAPVDVASALSRAAMVAFSIPEPEAGPLVTLASRMKELTSVLADWENLLTDLDNTVEFERAPEPWVQRATELKQTKLNTLDTEAELKRTLETLRSRDIAVKEKERELEEQSVKIEMLEARMRDASKRSARIAELESVVHELKEEIRKSKRELEKTRGEVSRQLEAARHEGAQSDGKPQGRSSSKSDDRAASEGVAWELKIRQQKTDALESTVRYLTQENHQLRLPAPDSPLAVQQTLSWLHDDAGAIPTYRSQASSHCALPRDVSKRKAKEILARMLDVATSKESGVRVDLSTLPDNKLAWRPARERGRWKVEKAREEWEALKAWA